MTMRKFLVLALVVLAAHGACVHGSEDANGSLSRDAATCADDTCNAVSLLQVSAARRNGSESALWSEDDEWYDESWVISKKPPGVFLNLDQNEDGWKLTTNNHEPLRWVFGTYHKTGCELSIGICWDLGQRQPNHVAENIKKGLDALGHHVDGEYQVETAFTTYAFNNWYFEPKYSVVLKLQHYRYVHMIREPADWIVSCYTWHSIQDEFTEPWLAWPMNKYFDLKACPDENNCKKGDYLRYGLLPKLVHDQSSLSELVDPEYRQLFHKLNNSVHAGESMPKFYSEVSQMEGIVVEAYRTRATIELMVDNYLSSRNDQFSAQVRMEKIKQDFEGSMRCMMAFLKQSSPASSDFDIDWAMKGIDHLNVEKYGQQAAQKGGKAEPWHFSTMSAEQKEKLLNRLNSLSFVAKNQNLLKQPAVNDC